MKRIYLLVLLALVFCGCRRNPASVTKNQRIAAVQFNPDGRRILTTSTDGKVRIWDARTGQALSTELSRYQSGTPDNMPIVGGDNFKVLQDQIDALEKRVRELETKASPSSR
jgi:WD40 repeat protein